MGKGEGGDNIKKTKLKILFMRFFRRVMYSRDKSWEETLFLEALIY